MDLLSGRAATSHGAHVHRRRSRWGSLLGVLAALAVATGANAGAWSSPFHFTSDGKGSVDTNHTLSASGTTAHAIYTRNLDTLAYRRSTNSGTSWSAETVLQPPEPTNTVGYQGLAVASSGNLVVVLYRADSINGVTPTFHAYYSRRSINGGQTWLARTTLASTTTSSFYGSDGDLGVSGTHVLAAWTNGDTGRVLTRRSVDGGATWKPVLDIGSTSLQGNGFVGADAKVTVAVSGMDADVAWVQGSGAHYQGLSLRRSSDGGASFSPRQVVTTAALWRSPSLAANGQTVLLLYGLPNGTVKLARSTNGGAVLTQADVAPAATGRFPGDIAVSGTKARLAYRQGGKIWTRSSGDSGATWAAPDQAYNGLSGYRVNVVPAGTATVVAFDADTTPFDTDVWSRRST